MKINLQFDIKKSASPSLVNTNLTTSKLGKYTKLVRDWFCVWVYLWFSILSYFVHFSFFFGRRISWNWQHERGGIVTNQFIFDCLPNTLPFCLIYIYIYTPIIYIHNVTKQFASAWIILHLLGMNGRVEFWNIFPTVFKGLLHYL